MLQLQRFLQVSLLAILTACSKGTPVQADARAPHADAGAHPSPAPVGSSGLANDASGGPVQTTPSGNVHDASADGVMDASSGAVDAAPQCEPLHYLTKVGNEEVAGARTGLLYCGGESQLVDDLPDRCERAGEDWTLWDGGRPVRCSPYECTSGMCDPADGSTCLPLSQCVEDADCGAGEACVCTQRRFNRCLPATCRAATDCDGLSCGVSTDLCGLPESLRCHTPADECQLDTDCVKGGPQRCQYDEAAGNWRCQPQNVCD